MPEFNGLLKKISNGTEVCSDELLRFINQEDLTERLWINFELAKVFYQTGKNEQAKVFMHRVWLFSGFDEKYLSLFIKIHYACNDIEAIKSAHKSLGFKAVKANHISAALNHFNAWQYTYSVYRGVDKYSYDLEVLKQIALLANPHLLPLSKQSETTHRKIRLAYLMFGMTHINSVIVKISLIFAQFHDPAVFEVVFFIPEQQKEINDKADAIANIKKINGFGWQTVTAPDSTCEATSLIHLATRIHEFNPDILITSAALADFKHYFITAMQPSPVVIGFCQGPPAQFIAPNFDWSIAWTIHPLLDCPTDCSLVRLGFNLPQRRYTRQEIKLELGIPEHNLVLMSCGRREKFMDSNFWNMIVEVVSSYPNSYYVAVGLESPPVFIAELIPDDIARRIMFIGWEKDFLKVLSMADMVIDTYPSGGGVAIMDAMALGTPVVAFKNNYLQNFCQTDWSPAQEFLGMPELLIERGDFEAFKKLLIKLLTDQAYRKNLSERCVERIKETSGNPEQMVRNCEKIYLDVIRKKRLYYKR